MTSNIYDLSEANAYHVASLMYRKMKKLDNSEHWIRTDDPTIASQ